MCVINLCEGLEDVGFLQVYDQDIEYVESRVALVRKAVCFALLEIHLMQGLMPIVCT